MRRVKTYQTWQACNRAGQRQFAEVWWEVGPRRPLQGYEARLPPGFRNLVRYVAVAFDALTTARIKGRKVDEQVWILF